MATIPVPVEVFEMDESSLMNDAITKEVRQQLLEAFFRRVFSTVSRFLFKDLFVSEKSFNLT